MRRLLGIYRQLFIAQFQAAAQYRVQMFLWLFFSVIRPIIFLAAWTAVAATQGGTVAGFSTRDFAAYYIALTFVTHLTMAWNQHEFEFEVRAGRLSPKLLRPLHPIHYAVVENVVWKAFTITGLVPVLFAIAWTFDASLPLEPARAAFFVPSLLLGAALLFVHGWFVASAAFWITRIGAITTLDQRLAFIFAGQIAPLVLLPGPLQVVAYVLPHGYMLGVPAGILSGAFPLEQAPLLLLGQTVWLAISFMLLQFAWRAGLRQYSAVGI